VSPDWTSDKLLEEALKHRSVIMAVIVAMVRDFGAADDIFQDTVLQIAHSHDRFDESRDFLRWAKGIARNMALRHFDSKARQPMYVDQDLLEVLNEVMAEEPEPEPEIWEKERAGLHHCMQKLPEKNRVLIMLRYMENLRGMALAEKAGIQITSLRTTLARIRQALRDCVDQYLKGMSVMMPRLKNNAE